MRISTAMFRLNNLNGIFKQQQELAKIQEQLATGVKDLNAVETRQILNLELELQLNERYQGNIRDTQSFAGLQENQLNTMNDAMYRLRELAVQANNGVLDASARSDLAENFINMRDLLIDVANAKDANGNYMFSGSLVDVKPVSKTTAGHYVYNGDQTQTQLAVSNGVNVAKNETGFDAFFDIQAGRGALATNSNYLNSGSGVISVGTVVDSDTFLTDVVDANETVTVTYNNGTGNLDIANIAGAIASVPYVSGQTLTYEGVEFVISGTLDDGDSFTINSPEKVDVFSNLERVIDRLQSLGNSEADGELLAFEIDYFLETLDYMQNNVNQTMAKIGSKQNVLDAQEIALQNSNLINQEITGQIRDVDFAEAVTRMTLITTSLEATYGVMSKTNVSLANYVL